MILCCGEALIDMFPRQTREDEPAFAPYAGGAVFNTALALGRLGEETVFFSGLSTDHFGKILCETLRASKVSFAPAHISDRPTTLAFLTLNNGQAQYEFYDENSAGRMLTQADLPPPNPATKALFFGGISLMVEPCGSAYETLALRDADQSVIMLDPNIRPRFIQDESAYRARLNRLIGVCDILKLSDEDLIWIEGQGTLADLAQKCLSRGPKIICLTEGAKGATLFCQQGTYFAPAPAVKVVDTVCAGDTFNAAFLAGLVWDNLLDKRALYLAHAHDFAQAMSMGVGAAALSVTRAGANPPYRHEVENFII